MGRLTYGVLAVSLVLYAITGCAKHAVRTPVALPPTQGATAAGLPVMFSGPSHPPPETGVTGDFFLDVLDSLLYGPKTVLGWGVPFDLPYEVNFTITGPQLWTGSGAPVTEIGNIRDFYLNLGAATLYGPKSAVGWGAGWPLGGDSTSAPPPPNIN